MVLAVPAFNLYAIGGNHDGNPFQGDSTNYVGFVALDNEASPAIFEFTTGNDTVFQVLNGPRAGKTGGIDNGPSSPDVRNAVYFGNDPFPNVTCQVTDNSDGTCPLSCQGIRGNTSYGCDVAWRIGSTSDVASCGGSAFTRYAVGV